MKNKALWIVVGVLLAAGAAAGYFLTRSEVPAAPAERRGSAGNSRPVPVLAT